MAVRFHTIIAMIVLLACAMARPAHAENPEATDTVLSRISSLLQNGAEPVGIEFFVDYFGVFQGNPVGGKSQGVAYSQYLPFGLTLEGALRLAWGRAAGFGGFRRGEQSFRDDWQRVHRLAGMGWEYALSLPSISRANSLR